MVEGARLESVCRGNSTVGSNPTLSATQSLQCSHYGIARGSPPFFSLYLRVLSTVAGGEPGGQTRPGPGDVPGVRVIVSRAGFPGPGCVIGKSLPGYRSRRRRTSDRASARPNSVARQSLCARESGIPDIPHSPARSRIKTFDPDHMKRPTSACSNSPQPTTRYATRTSSPPGGPGLCDPRRRRCAGHPPSLERPPANRPWRTAALNWSG